MFDDLMQSVVDANLKSVNTSIPARIIEITDYKQQKATVQPLVQERSRDVGKNPKGLQDMPVLQNVPIIFPSASFGSLTFPIKAGDIVCLMFSQRSIDNFLYTDGSSPVDPDDYRKHNYNDAYAIAGLYPFSKALGIDPDNAVFKMNSGTGNEVKISLTPSGDVIIDSPTKVTVNATSDVEVNTETATINASGSVTIDSPQTTMTGELRVDGGVSIGSDVETDAGFSGNTHKHIGNLSKPTSTFI